jgi:hypothetical protein
MYERRLVVVACKRLLGKVLASFALPPVWPPPPIGSLHPPGEGASGAS